MTNAPSTRQRIQARARAHQLASDERAGTWIRGQVRLRWLQFVRRQWRVLGAMGGSAAVLITIVAVLVRDEFARGLVVGAGAAGTLAALWTLVDQMAGTATWRAGATAEQWTASELRQLRRDGYRLFNHVSLGSGDIDHVLIGPAGVIVGETKWSADSWDDQSRSARVADAARQASNSARQCGLWGRAFIHTLPTTRPVVFLWSAARPDREAPDHDEERPYTLVDGTTVVSGYRSIHAWLDRVRDTPATLSASDIERLSRAVEAQIARRDTADATRSPVPPTFNRVYWTGLATLAAFFGAFMINAEVVLHLTRWLWLAVLAACAAIGAGAAARRLPRPVTVGWLLGTALSAALVAADAVSRLLNS